MNRDVFASATMPVMVSLIEIEEWFRRYTMRLMEVCSPQQPSDFSVQVWTTWGCVDSIAPLYQFYQNHPEQAAEDVFSCELRRRDDNG